MHTKKIAALFFLVGLLSLAGCYYDNLDELHPAAAITNDCVTVDTVLFSQHVWPIMQTYCGTTDAGCHAANTSSGTIITNYDDVNTIAQDGRLIGTITHDPDYHPMPKAGGKLKDCLITEIQDWINQGAQNN